MLVAVAVVLVVVLVSVVYILGGDPPMATSKTCGGRSFYDPASCFKHSDAFMGGGGLRSKWVFTCFEGGLKILPT